MPRAPILSHLESVPDLIRFKRWDHLLVTFRQALALASSRADGIEVQHAMRTVPLELRATAHWRRLAARAAYRGGDLVSCAEVVKLAADEPRLLAFRAWVLAEQEDFQGALELSAAALQGDDEDVALRVRAFANAKLQNPDWLAVYADSLARLNGRQRGLSLLELGAFQSFRGDSAAARSAYAEALTELREDRHFAAQLHYNLAIACLRLDLPDEALGQAEQSRRHADHPDGSRFRGRSWSGLGAAQRARGELPRSLHAYRNAVALSSDADDRIQAWRGLARTLRVVGRVPEALTELYEVVKFDASFVRVWSDIAAAKLQNNDSLGALEALETLGAAGFEEECQRATIVRAELARRAGHEAPRAFRPANRGKALLEAQVAASLIRDERFCFPELFASTGHFFETAKPMRLRVSMDGPVRVYIGDRELPEPLTKREAAVLTCLAHAQGSLTTERLLDAVTTIGGSTQRLRAQTLSRVAGELRASLGWPEAITVERSRSVYRLDPRIIWETVYPAPDRADAFCDGLNDRWVEEWREAQSHRDLEASLRA